MAIINISRADRIADSIKDADNYEEIREGLRQISTMNLLQIQELINSIIRNRWN